MNLTNQFQDLIVLVGFLNFNTSVFGMCHCSLQTEGGMILLPPKGTNDGLRRHNSQDLSIEIPNKTFKENLEKELFKSVSIICNNQRCRECN